MSAFTLLAAAAAAQPQPSGEQPQSPIVVTGERVKRSLKQTTSSVAVFDGRDIDSLAAADRLQNVLEMVPNVLVPTSRDAPTIRGQRAVGVLQGLPAFLGGARPRTALQIDGRTVTFNEFANSSEGLWDVDHVEIFRSPQTTTQGVNSIAGAIFIHTTDPQFAPEAKVRAIVGQSMRRQLSAAADAPLIDEQLALRVSADLYRSRTSTTETGPVIGIGNLNVDRYWTTRAKLLAQPKALPGLSLLVTYAHNNSQAPQIELARPPYRDRRDPFYPYGYFKSNVDSVTALATYRLTEALQSRTTLSWGKSRFRRFAPEGFGQTRIRGDDRSLETLLEWKGETANAIVGVSLQRTRLNQFINLEAARLGTGNFADTQHSSGLFGEITWKAAPRLALTAGARLQSDSKRRLGVLQVGPGLPLDYDRISHAVLPKASAAYDLTDQLRVGVLAQRAYNPGGVTLDPAHSKQLEFRPEYLWDYEAFSRGSLAGGAVTFEANLFFNAIRDAQRELDFDLSSPGGRVGLLQIISEPRARSYGAELQASARVNAMLTLRGAIGLLHTRITRTIAANDPALGKAFAGAPHFTGNAGAEWSPLPRLRLDAQVRHTSGFFGDDHQSPDLRVSGWTTIDARASWTARRFTLFAYAQNLLDSFHIVGWPGPAGPDREAIISEPREIGIGIEGRF